MNFETVLAAFFSPHDIIDIHEYGSGHIHETFLVTIEDFQEKYILQKLNTSVFKDVSALQNNIEKVTRYIDEIRPNQPGSLKVIRTIDKRSFYVDSSGGYWRVFNFIKGSHTYDTITSTAIAQEGGKALGKFLRDLHHFPVEELHVTLPCFHDLDYRYKQFSEAIERDSHGLKKDLAKEIAVVKHYVQKFKKSRTLFPEVALPIRVTHNDPKFNNILFSSDNQSICLIDLDTVMPGYLYYDFGDAIRTGAASAPEDVDDSRKMFLRLELFQDYAAGFLLETREILRPEEVSVLAIAPQLMTFIIGLRFLTDHFNGDIYFKTNRQNHNLQRWLAQKALLLDMEVKEDKMNQIIEEIIHLQS